MNIAKLFKNNKGVSIYIAMMIMVIMLTIVFGLTAILTTQIKTVRNIGYSVTAFYAAETGIEEALFDYPNCSSTCPGFGNKTLNLEGSEVALYTVTGDAPGLECLATYYCLISVGEYRDVRRAIQMTR